MSTPKFLKKKGDPDHIYHIYTDALMARGDMEAFEPKLGPARSASGISLLLNTAAQNVTEPANEPIPTEEQVTIIESVEVPADDRLDAIKKAILTIPVENYGKPGMGRPAMPKVKEVSEICGFKVSVDEVAAAMPTTEG